MDSAKYVIIGNSAAAVGAVAGIRENDPQGSIAIVAQEPEHTYSRPLITYLLGGKVDEAGMYYRPANFYDRNQVEAKLGVAVEKIDAGAGKLTLADGSSLGYEKLLIATGGTPIVPPDMTGADLEGVFTFTTWQDSRDIAAYIEANQVEKAVVVGGGLIGLKSVEALVARGVGTTVVELADRVLAVTLDGPASRLASRALSEAGVTLITENTVASIDGDGGKVAGVTLKDGTKVDCQMVILSIGVLPAKGLAVDAGIDCDRGILTDEAMATSQEGVFAAGDVAQAKELLSGERRSIPIWPNAFRQGYIAGINMAGGEALYEGGLAMNSVEICGLPTMSAGITVPPDDDYQVIESLDEAASVYKKVVLKDGRVVGFVFVGDIDRAGIITGLIKAKVDVTGLEDRLLGAEFGLIALPGEHRERITAGMGAVA